MKVHIRFKSYNEKDYNFYEQNYIIKLLKGAEYLNYICKSI